MLPAHATEEYQGNGRTCQRVTCTITFTLFAVLLAVLPWLCRSGWTSILLWYGGCMTALLILLFLVAVLLLFSTRSCPCHACASFTEKDGMEHTQVIRDLSRGQGVRVQGYWTPSSADPNAPAIVVTHGHNGAILRRKGDGDFIDKCAHPLYKRGFSVLCVDLRNHGNSAYRPPVTLGVREAEDVLAGHEWLQHEKGFQPESIGLLGESMGASTVLIAAGKLGSTVKAVVVDSPFESFDATFTHWLKDKIGVCMATVIWRYLRFCCSALMWCTSGLSVSDTNVVAAVERCTADIFHSHGLNDETVPFANSQSIANAAQQRKASAEYKFFEYSLGHTQAYMVPGYHDMLEDFFWRHLKRKAF